MKWIQCKPIDGTFKYFIGIRIHHKWWVSVFQTLDSMKEVH